MDISYEFVHKMHLICDAFEIEKMDHIETRILLLEKKLRPGTINRLDQFNKWLDQYLLERPQLHNTLGKDAFNCNGPAKNLAYSAWLGSKNSWLGLPMVYPDNGEDRPIVERPPTKSILEQVMDELQIIKADIAKIPTSKYSSHGGGPL